MNEHWVYRSLSWIFIVFCLELGVFLLVYPWTLRWQINTIPAWLPALQPYWNSDYLRGAVSGLGLLDLWVALVEMFRPRRTAVN